MSLTLLPEPHAGGVIVNGDGEPRGDGKFLLHLAALERRMVGDVLHEIRCDVAVAGSSRLVSLDEKTCESVQPEFDERDLGRCCVALIAACGLIRIFTTKETFGAIVLTQRRTASVLLEDGTWTPATVSDSIGPYIAVRWTGGLVMLT